MYMAPEILLSTKEKGYEAFPVDLWSSGIALYIMLSGTLPFSLHNNDFSISQDDKSNNYTLQYSIINNQPKKIENISKFALDLLNGLLNKNPKKRLTCDEVLNHPWLKDNINDNCKYHLFTKAEMIVLSKTYIDYRYAKIDDIKENFTLSNLEIDDNNSNNNNLNVRTKSYILAPYNSMKNYFQSEEESDEDSDDFSDMELRLENGIINFGNKVREFNLNYELNNNGELDNGMLINTKTDTISNSIRNNTSHNNNNNNDFFFHDDLSKYNNLKKDNFKSEVNEKEKILNQLQNLGYEKNYVINCLNNNIICHATTVYYLMMNYDNF